MTNIQSTGKMPDHYDDIVALVNSGNENAAIHAIENFIREHPDHALAHNDLGVLYYRAGNYLQTLGHYEKAVRLSPLNSAYRKNLASFYYVEMGWVDDAIFIYTDILRSEPGDVETLVALGIISRDLGQTEQARIFWNRAADLEPWNDDVRKALHSLNAPQATTPPAPPVPERAIENPPADLDAIIASLRNAIKKQDEGIPEPSYERALELAGAGNTDEAIRELEGLLLKHPANALAHNDLGVLYMQRGDLPKSQENHELAVKINPRNPNFRKNLASLYYAKLSRTDDAIEIYVSLLKEYPDDVDTLSALGIISMENNRPEEALIFLNKVAELEPWNGAPRRLIEQLKK